MKIQTRFTTLILLSFVFILSDQLTAQWTKCNGPYGGVINCIASNSRKLFAGTSNGLYESSDNGSNWQIVKSFKAHDIHVFDSTIFISTDNDIMVSKDDGTTWKTIEENFYISILGHNNKFALNGNYIAYAKNPFRNVPGISSYLEIAKFDSSLSMYENDTAIISMKITDDSFGIPPYINSIIFNTEFIVAGTNYGVYLSSDTGKTWTRSNTNLTDSTIESVAMFGQKLFAGTYKSGIFCSTDNGRNWLPCNSGLTSMSISTISINKDTIYAGTNGSGIFVSIDSGKSWNQVNAGLSNLVVNSIYFDNDVPIAGTSGGGVFIFNGSWQQKDMGLDAMQINSFTAAGNNLFAGSQGCGIYRSNNNGINWTAINSGLTDLNINSLIVKGSSIFAGTVNGGVFRSNDNGGNWTEINNGITAKHINSFAVCNDNIFASSLIPAQDYTYSGVIFRSSDNGNTWTVADSGLTSIYDMAVLDSNIFVATQSGIIRSGNGGKSWTNYNINTSNNSPAIVESFCVKGKELFAGTDENGIYKCNSMNNWEAINDSIKLKYLSFFTSMISNDSTVFAYCLIIEGQPGWLYYSTNDGNIWKEVPQPSKDGLWPSAFQSKIVSLSIYNNYLFIGMEDLGVWKVTLSNIMTGIEKNNNEAVTAFRLDQNYPNPFNPATIVRYSVPKTGMVTIKVYNILGKQVATLVNESKAAGNYQVQFNAGKLASGVYFYRMESGSYVETKKLLLLK
ncbi:MAG: T9SS type A sorting domain-containing protein [Ignavibacteriaceae bacterium]|nr:T9SS type A sorting domain-containing protein [Ignavibacteriaceae bacterium]